MRICIFSNSHGASLKQSLSTHEPFEGVDFTVFAAPAQGLESLSFDGNSGQLTCSNEAVRNMIALTSGGRESVVIDEYDAFLFHGLYFTVPRLDRRHSKAIRQATLMSALKNSLGLRIARALRQHIAKPILLSPEPLRADVGGPKKTPPSVSYLQPLNYTDIGNSMAELIDEPTFDFLWQTPTSIGPKLNTLIQYSTGSERVVSREKHLVGDTRHMNGDYGRLVLAGAVEHLLG